MFNQISRVTAWRSRAAARLAGALGVVAAVSACKELFPDDSPTSEGAGGGRVTDGAGGAGTSPAEEGAAGDDPVGSGESGGVTGFGNATGASTSDGGVQRPVMDGGLQPPSSGDSGPGTCPLPDAPAVPAVQLTLVAGGLEQPVFVTAAPGDRERLFVVEKPGRIRIIANGAALEEAFLDITDRVQDAVEEMGLLGLAFHPRYRDNGLFYVMYSTASQGGYNPAHTAILAEYAVDPENPDRALSAERRLMEIAEPEGNHNGGNLAFGPDGLLYIGLGDGGGGGDNHGDIGNGQALDTLLGKLLRIDVDGRGAGDEGAYAIPAGNYVEQNAAALPEIWSYGLRNPWRFSFDSCSGDLYIGDVGQESREEIDFQPALAAAGRNYGWRLMEAELCYEPELGCDSVAQGITPPITSYDRETGQSIIGGYVYWGQQMPAMRGTYLYADYLSAAFFALRLRDGALDAQPEDISERLNPARGVQHISSFGRDDAGELYVVSFDGQVYRIDPE